MQYRNLGRTGLKVSELCLGSMQFGWTADEATSFEVLNAAYDAGINFIDSANIYSRWAVNNPGGVAESIIGDWMHKERIPRGEVVIATKLRGPMGQGPNAQGLSRVHILSAVEESLRRLQAEYIDLYQAHWFDDTTPIEETLSAFDDLVHQGKVRYIGCSNYPAWRLMQALWTADRLQLVRYDSLQPHYNLVHREEFEAELADVCQVYGLGVIPYSPLAGGFLTGKYRRDRTDVESARAGGVSRYFTEENWKILDALDTIARDRNCSVSQVSLAWLLTQPVVTSPIIGPRDLEQLRDNLASAELRLSEEELEMLTPKK